MPNVNIDDFINYVKENNLGNIFENTSLKKYTTLKMGGIGKVIYCPFSIKTLQEAYNYILDYNLSYVVIGNGSNLLINDGYLNIIFIHLINLNTYEIDSSNLKLISYAGINLNYLSYEISKLGYNNLEFLAGIPATLGGAIYMNVGSWGYDMSEILDTITYLDSNAKIITKKVSRTDFSYRMSCFQKMKGIILWAELKLKKSSTDAIKLYNYYWQQKKHIQPLSQNSAGCAFKNLENISTWQIIKNTYHYPLQIGDAAISDTHYNFLINKKSATFVDMEKLILKIQQDVYEKHHIYLELEWQIIK